MKIVEEYQGGTGRIGRTQDDVITFVPYPGLTTTSMDRLEKDIVVFKKMKVKKECPFFLMHAT